MEISKIDLARAELVTKALKRGKFELEGEEILAFSQGFQWLGDIMNRIKAHLDSVAAKEKAELEANAKMQLVAQAEAVALHKLRSEVTATATYEVKPKKAKAKK